MNAATSGWTLLIAVVALAVSVFNSVWQYRESRRKRKPDITVKAHHIPGPLKVEGDRSQDNHGDYRFETVSFDILAPAPATITSVGLAPGQGRVRRARPIESAYGRRPGVNGGHSLPMPIEDRLWIRVDVPNPLPAGIRRGAQIRGWALTSSGHRFFSGPFTLEEPKP